MSFQFTPHLKAKIAIFAFSKSYNSHATFYEIFIFYMFVCNDMQEKTYKKDCLRFFGKKHYEMKQTRREFNKIARKCKAIYVSLMVDLSVIPIKKAKTSQCSLV